MKKELNMIVMTYPLHFYRFSSFSINQFAISRAAEKRGDSRYPHVVDLSGTNPACGMWQGEGSETSMREMEFKMERPGLLKEGDRVTVTEGVLPSNYYYTIDPSLAMSGNFPFRERMLEREGVVTEVIENARGFYVKARFGE